MDEQDSQGTCQLRFTWKNSRWTEVIVDLWHDYVRDSYRDIDSYVTILPSLPT